MLSCGNGHPHALKSTRRGMGISHVLSRRAFQVWGHYQRHPVCRRIGRQLGVVTTGLRRGSTLVDSLVDGIENMGILADL